MSVVIYSEEAGVYLGGAFGMGFWSKLDPVGQDAACTFESAELAASLIEEHAGFPEDVTFVSVCPDMADGYASIAACMAAGLPGWLDEYTPVANMQPV